MWAPDHQERSNLTLVEPAKTRSMQKRWTTIHLAWVPPQWSSTLVFNIGPTSMYHPQWSSTLVPPQWTHEPKHEPKACNEVDNEIYFCITASPTVRPGTHACVQRSKNDDWRTTSVVRSTKQAHARPYRIVQLITKQKTQSHDIWVPRRWACQKLTQEEISGQGQDVQMVKAFAASHVTKHIKVPHQPERLNELAVWAETWLGEDECAEHSKCPEHVKRLSQEQLCLLSLSCTICQGSLREVLGQGCCVDPAPNGWYTILLVIIYWWYTGDDLPLDQCGQRPEWQATARLNVLLREVMSLRQTDKYHHYYLIVMKQWPVDALQSSSRTSHWAKTHQYKRCCNPQSVAVCTKLKVSSGAILVIYWWCTGA